MDRVSLVVDIMKCSGCQSCEVACKQANNLPVGLSKLPIVATAIISSRVITRNTMLLLSL